MLAAPGILWPLLLLATPAADPPASITDRNAFAIDLMKQIAPTTGSGNVVISPPGVTKILAMAAVGADGPTADEIRLAGRLPVSVRSLFAFDPALPVWRLGLKAKFLENDGYGVKLDDVTADSSAERAGLSAGDLILSVDDRPVRSLSQLLVALDIPQRAGPARLKIYAVATGEVVEKRVAIERIDSPSPFAEQAAVFVQEGLPIVFQFYESMEKSFHASFAQIAFQPDPMRAVAQIEKWATGLGDEVPRPDLSGIDTSTRLVLASAVAFNADWERPFPPDAPGSFKNQDGKSIEVPTLARIGRYAVATAPDGSKILEIPYANGSFSMLIALPAANLSPRLWLSKLTAESFEEGRKSLKPRRVELSLPRFRVDSRNMLNKPLQAMGAKLAFTPKADFSNMAAVGQGPVMLGPVVQATYLEVTPRGTKAGAITTAAAVGLDAEDEPMPFHADRPFAFFVIDRRTGGIAFSGLVEEL